MDIFWTDLRFAIRNWLRQPRLTAIAVGSLAIAIAAATTVFSIISGILLRPLPYADPSALVSIRMDHPQRGLQRVGPSLLELEDLTRRTTSFTALAAFNEEEFNVGTARPVRVTGAAVSATLFPMLGVVPSLGRAFVREDDVPGVAPVAMISNSMWQREFASNHAVVGSLLRVNGVQHSVIGVMPVGFRFPEAADLWVPVRQYAPAPGTRRERGWEMYGRLKPGISIERAAEDVRRVGAVLSASEETNRGWTMTAVPLSETRGEDAVPVFFVLMAAVVFVLLIACGNLATLLLARGLARRGELAVRATLGASRSRLVKQMLTETLVLSLSGGVLGVLLATWGVRLATINLETQGIPFWMSFGVDYRVLLFSLATTVITGILFGSVPALTLSRTNLRDAMTGTGRSAIGPRRRFVGFVIASELALALALVTGAGHMLVSLAGVQRTDLGYDYHNLLTGVVDPLESEYEDRSVRRSLHGRVITELEAVPGVSSAAAFYPVFGRSFEIGGESRPPVDQGSQPEYRITPDYFNAMRIPLRSGRAFSSTDVDGATPVAIVNEELARTLWRGQNPVGKQLRVRDSLNAQPWITVVGVVGNVRRNPTDPEIEAHVYRPFAQEPPRRMHLVLRTSVSPLSIVGAVEAAVQRAAPGQPLNRVMTMEAQISDWFGPARFFAIALGSFAVFALTLACMGIYGVTAQAVQQRTREIGIRMALGATRRNVLGLLIRQHMRTAIVGLAVGVAASFGLAQVLVALPFGVTRSDPLLVVGLSALLTMVALTATYVPAGRAVQRSPTDALRAD